ncbi:MAG: HD domain-containing phosphohydrolase [Lachnospiraceae bacterium]
MVTQVFQADKTLIHTLIEQTPIAYIIMDDQFRIHYVNESFLTLRKLNKDTTIGETCYNISNGGKPCVYCSVARALETGEKALIQRKDILPDGNIRYIDDYAFPLFRDADTGRTYLLEIMVNRTEELTARQQYNSDVEEVISTLVGLLEAKDTYTALHSKNVHKYATQIARHMHLSEEDTFHISLAALLHDIGKVKIPLEILNKPGKLSDAEFHTIQSHPGIASDMLDNLIQLKDLTEMVRHHHERVDGHGYPDGLSSNNLSLGSRILAVADTYDAMTTDRPYRKAFSRETALEEIHRVSGSQLDSTVVEAFSSIPEAEISSGKSDSDIETPNKAPNRTLPLLVRQLPQERLTDVRTDLVVELHTLGEQIDRFQLQAAIFEQTPCGYVVLDSNNTMLYANPYFLSLIGASAEDLNGQPFSLFEPQPKDIVRKSCTRMMRKTLAGIRTFDLYSMENTDSDYRLYTVIDRTKDAEMTRQMDRELQQLLQLLQQLLLAEEEENGLDFCSPEELNFLKNRIEDLSNRRKQQAE